MGGLLRSVIHRVANRVRRWRLSLHHRHAFHHHDSNVQKLHWRPRNPRCLLMAWRWQHWRQISFARNSSCSCLDLLAFDHLHRAYYHLELPDCPDLLVLRRSDDPTTDDPLQEQSGPKQSVHLLEWHLQENVHSRQELIPTNIQHYYYSLRGNRRDQRGRLAGLHHYHQVHNKKAEW